MSLLDDVANTLTAPFTSAAEGISRLWNAVKGLFNQVKNTFLHLGDAWSLLYNGVSHLLTGALAMGNEALTAVESLVTRTIPRAALWALAKAEHAASAALTYSIHRVETLAGRILRYLESVVRNVEHRLLALLNWILKRVNAIVHWIDHAAAKAVSLVLHPERLVQWVIPHLILPLIRFMVSSSKPIIRWIAHHIIGILGDLAPEIEAVIKEFL